MNTIHLIASEDTQTIAAMRYAAAPHKGELLGPEARPMFDAMFMAIPVTPDVEIVRAKVGGIPGFWCRPGKAQQSSCILLLHGGGYVLGSAQAFTNFASRIAKRIGVDTFVPDYRLAPEHPFPAAIDDVVAAYHGLLEEGVQQIMVVGDSTGGGLALSLLSIIAQAKMNGIRQPTCASVMSPWADLALTGLSMTTRAAADPVFTKDVLAALAATYLAGHPANDPRASALYAELGGLPPIRIDVGDDEVLLDDSLRYAQLARAAGARVCVSIWEGMPHVFQSSLGRLVTADHSLDAIAEFLRVCLISEP